MILHSAINLHVYAHSISTQTQVAKKTRQHSRRMRTARLLTIHVVVASTRSRYLGWVSQVPCPGDIHTHPSGIPTPKPWYTPSGIPTPP